ncbi:LysR family transcriptional regulator [Photobacterium halotolerans]|uniref:LysR family transcriptional regulator n=1 Tax=Photobacterium halotolerans TaxID=265726 RepID=A0A7X4WCG8_9GAMM|nr:LysR family transcriptional regulator [Photobacterium halotolerans]NAW66133.1 LysR family transcriptional regulator [Photobacterium halotolerans]
MTIISRTEELEIFLAVVDSGGFSAAASQLDLQVAKVSRAIARLEAELGVSLLTRTTRRVELTEEGRFFAEHIRNGLSQISDAEEKLRGLKGQPAGRLRVDSASPFILHQLVPHIAEFRAQYPDIDIELISSESIIDLIEKRTDLAIRIGELKDSNLHAKFLGRSALRIVASPAYLATFGTPQTAADLAQHQCIGFAGQPSLNKWPLISGSYTPLMSLQASSGETVRQLCLEGNGLALLSNFMVCRDLAAGRLVAVMDDTIASPNNREPVQAVYYKNSALSPRIRAFLDFIAEKLCL